MYILLLSKKCTSASYHIKLNIIVMMTFLLFWNRTGFRLVAIVFCLEQNGLPFGCDRILFGTERASVWLRSYSVCFEMKRKYVSLSVVPCRRTLQICTQRNGFIFLVVWTVILLYYIFSSCSGTKQDSGWFQNIVSLCFGLNRNLFS